MSLMARSGLAAASSTSPKPSNGLQSPNLAKRIALNQLPPPPPHLQMYHSRGTNPVSGATVDIYENPSEHYGEINQQQLQPLYYMEDGFNGPMLKVGYGKNIFLINLLKEN